MKEKNSNGLSMINATILLICVYNILYWGSKFLGWVPAFNKAVMGHWKLIMFLEFLAVASIAVDVIVRYDKFDAKYRRLRLALCSVLGFLFMLRLILGIIELYMRGEVR